MQGFYRDLIPQIPAMPEEISIGGEPYHLRVKIHYVVHEARSAPAHAEYKDRFGLLCVPVEVIDIVYLDLFL